MSALAGVSREAGLLTQDRSFLTWIGLTAILALIAVYSGVTEVSQQRASIQELIIGDKEDRLDAQAQQADWGGAAYYSHHLTYDAPSSFAFAALGTRDQEPWKHRIHVLALEGQIYGRDASNPVLALTGRFDFAFFAAFVLPLIVIVLLHDLQASERSAGRHALLMTTSRRASSPWRVRAGLKSSAVFAASALPLLGGCVASGASWITTAFAIGFLFAYLLFWSFIAYQFARWERDSSVLLASLLGVWVMLGVVGPAAGKLLIDRAVPLPDGADIVLTQREAVNDAWDLPKETTMNAFIANHPQWADYTAMQNSFEWKWYYAFQQVGDETAEALSLAYREGRLRRDRLAALVAWLTPPALLERSLQHLADTDLTAYMDYEGSVRTFHGELRKFYYAKLFPGVPFDRSALDKLPEYSALDSANTAGADIEAR